MPASAPAQVDVIIQGSAQGLTTAVTQAQKSLKQLGVGVTQAGGKFKLAMDGMMNAAKRVVAPMAAAAAAYVSFQAVMQSINRAGDLDKTSKALDINVEKLQELQYAASQTGGSAEGLSMGLREMGKFLTEARSGSEDAAKALEALGINLKSLDGLSQDEQFYRLADAISNVGDAQKRTSLAQDIFGRSSRDLAETLSTGSAELQKIAAAGREAGVVMAAMDVSALEGLGDIIDTFKQKMETAVGTMTAKLAPAIGGILEAMMNLGTVGDGTGNIMDKVSKSMVAGASLAAKAWYGVQMIFVSLGMALNVVAEGAAETVGRIFDGFTWLNNVLNEIWRTIVAAGEWAWSAVKKAALEAIGSIAEPMAAMTKSVGGHIRELGLLMNEAWEGSGDALVNAGEKAERFSTTLATDVKAGIASAKSDMDSAAETMSTTIDRITSAKADERPAWLKSINTYFEEARASGVALLDDLSQKALATQDQLAATFNKIGAPADNSEAEARARQQKEARYAAERAAAELVAIKEKLNKDLGMLEADYYKSSDFARMADIESAKNGFNEMSKVAQNYRMNEYDQQKIKIEEDSKNEQASFDAMLAHYEGMKTLIGGYEEDITALKAQHANNQLAFTEAQNQREIQVTAQKAAVIADVMGQAAALMDKNNKSQFIAWKVFASSQALINAFLAYSQVLASPFPDFFGITRTTMANVVLGLGLANAAKIASTPFGGKGSAGGGSVSVPSMERQDTSNQGGPGTNVNVAIYGNNFDQGSVRGLISAINEASSDNFQVKAT